MILVVMCSVCKKNVAVIFTNNIVNGKQELTGYCIPCAKKLGISPLSNMMGNMNMNEDDLENLNQQMGEVLGSMDLDNMNSNNPLMKLKVKMMQILGNLMRQLHHLKLKRKSQSQGSIWMHMG